MDLKGSEGAGSVSLCFILCLVFRAHGRIASIWGIERSAYARGRVF